jgi:hypothetical protein
MAGVYSHTTSTSSAAVIIDEAGYMMVKTYNLAYHPELVLLRYVDFSGKAVSSEGGTWQYRGRWSTPRKR